MKAVTDDVKGEGRSIQKNVLLHPAHEIEEFLTLFAPTLLTAALSSLPRLLFLIESSLDRNIGLPAAGYVCSTELCTAPSFLMGLT